MAAAKTIEVTRWTGTIGTIAEAEATTTETGDDLKIHRTCIEFLLTGTAAEWYTKDLSTCWGLGRVTSKSLNTHPRNKPDRTRMCSCYESSMNVRNHLHLPVVATGHNHHQQQQQQQKQKQQSVRRQ